MDSTQKHTEIPYPHCNRWLSSSPILRYHHPIQTLDASTCAYAAEEDEEVDDQGDEGEDADEEGFVQDPVLEEACYEEGEHGDCGGDTCVLE